MRTTPEPLYHRRVAKSATSPPDAASIADRVASILAVAEDVAEKMRLDAEMRMRERIAEADRAAENRVTTAEEEAAELIEVAQAEAARVRAEGEEAKTVAASEALTVVADAHKAAGTLVADATESAAKTRAEAEQRAAGMLQDARATADGVRDEGLLLVSNLRETGNSLRTNAERLLQDVQHIHARMVDELGPAARGTRPAGGRPSPRTSDREPPAAGLNNDEGLDVPDFIPPR